MARKVKRGPAPTVENTDPDAPDPAPEEAAPATTRPVLRDNVEATERRRKHRQKLSPAQVAREEKQRQRDVEALRLRKAGNDFAAIGRQLGLSTSGAHQAVKRALKDIVAPDAREFITLEMERLEGLYAVAYGALMRSVAATGGEDPHLGAMDRCLRIITQKAALMGVTDRQGNVNVVMGDQTITAESTTQQVVIAEGSKDAYIAALRAAREATGAELAGVVGEQPAEVYEMAMPAALPTGGDDAVEEHEGEDEEATG